jgi:hypothetical protein
MFCPLLLAVVTEKLVTIALLEVLMTTKYPAKVADTYSLSVAELKDIPSRNPYDVVIVVDTAFVEASITSTCEALLEA